MPSAWELGLFTLSFVLVSEVFIPSKLCRGGIRECEKHASLWKAGEGSCDLGRARLQETEAVLRQIEGREKAIWRGQENDFSLKLSLPGSPEKSSFILRVCLLQSEEINFGAEGRD